MPLASRAAGGGQKNIFPEPVQSQAPNLNTMALETTPSAPAAQTGSVGMGKYNIPPTPTNPQDFFHSEAADAGSQASRAQPQAASRAAKANRTSVLVAPPALTQLPSISQAPPAFPCPVRSHLDKDAPGPSCRRRFP